VGGAKRIGKRKGRGEREEGREKEREANLFEI